MARWCLFSWKKPSTIVNGDVDLSNYYTKKEVENLIDSNVLTNFSSLDSSTKVTKMFSLQNLLTGAGVNKLFITINKVKDNSPTDSTVYNAKYINDNLVTKDEISNISSGKYYIHNDSLKFDKANKVFGNNFPEDLVLSKIETDLNIKEYSTLNLTVVLQITYKVTLSNNAVEEWILNINKNFIVNNNFNYYDTFNIELFKISNNNFVYGPKIKGLISINNGKFVLSILGVEGQFDSSVKAIDCVSEQRYILGDIYGVYGG